jgi:hypothetical protein
MFRVSIISDFKKYNLQLIIFPSINERIQQHYHAMLQERIFLFFLSLLFDNMYIDKNDIEILRLKPGGTMDAKNTVLDVMKKEGAPLNAGRITEISGLDRKDVDKALKALKDEELIVSPKRCFWEPKN